MKQRSSEAGKGTIFRIYLPSIAEDLETKLSLETSEPMRGGVERILLVDVEEMIVEMQKSILEHLGYHRVTATTSSLKSLDFFQAAPDDYDLVISDQTMPELTGVELARTLMRQRPGLPVLLCTGYSSTISEEKAKAFGIRKFAMKPIERSNMARTVRRALDEDAASKSRK